jgi:hypothetical protein
MKKRKKKCRKDRCKNKNLAHKCENAGQVLTLAPVSSGVCDWLFDLIPGVAVYYQVKALSAALALIATISPRQKRLRTPCMCVPQPQDMLAHATYGHINMGSISLVYRMVPYWSCIVEYFLMAKRSTIGCHSTVISTGLFWILNSAIFGKILFVCCFRQYSLDDVFIEAIVLGECA